MNYPDKTCSAWVGYHTGIQLRMVGDFSDAQSRLIALLITSVSQGKM
jgi:hypothetical protein